MLKTKCHRLLATVVLATTLLVPMAVVSPPASARTNYSCYIVDAYVALWSLDGPPSFEAFAYWTDVLEMGGDRSELPEFLVSSEPWFILQIDGVYQQALDRLPTPRVRASLVRELENGASAYVLAKRVYGSSEFYKNAGGTPQSFVKEVFARALRRQATASEVRYWSSKLAIGASRESVAGALLNSIEARRHRVRDWFRYLIQRSPSAGELASWAGRLNGRDSSQMAAYLVSSRTFFQTSSSRGGCA